MSSHCPAFMFNACSASLLLTPLLFTIHALSAHMLSAQRFALIRAFPIFVPNWKEVERGATGRRGGIRRRGEDEEVRRV